MDQFKYISDQSRFGLSVNMLLGINATKNTIRLSALTFLVVFVMISFTSSHDAFAANPGLINGTAFVDSNLDGIKNVGEHGQSGVQITLTGKLSNGTLISSVAKTTGATGNYAFNKLSPGNYNLTEASISGWAHTSSPVISNIIVSANSLVKQNFGNVQIVANPSTSTVAQGNQLLVSSSTQNYHDGAKRVVQNSGVIFTFYYDLTNILYKTSKDNGITWSSSNSVGTGIIAEDNYAWEVAATKLKGKNYTILLYFTDNGTANNFFSKRGTNSGASIIWDNPSLMFSVPDSPGCSSGACGELVATTDSKGNIFAAASWAQSTLPLYNFEILESKDGGSTWHVSMNTQFLKISSRPQMALAQLSSGKMLFAVIPSDSCGGLSVNIFSGTGTGWSKKECVSGTGVSGPEQISSASSQNGTAYIAFNGANYPNPGPSTTLKVAVWNSTGSFSHIETPGNFLADIYLPSIVISPNGIIHIFTISGGKIYDTVKINGIWQTPSNPFGTSFSSPDQLTSGLNLPSALWIESNSTLTSLKFDLIR